MKKGFTLVELIVSIVIISLISGGALVYLNRFNSRQKLEKTKEEVVAAINLAKSYAKGRQLPPDSVEIKLKYVQVQMSSGGYLVVGANGVGSTYFQEKVNENNVLTVGLNPSILYFWPGSGYLSRNTLGEMFRNDEIAKAIIQSQNDLTGYYELTINALGQISDNKYVEGLIPISTPVPPTSTPGPSPPCSPPGVTCSINGDCCNNYCKMGRCYDPSSCLPPNYPCFSPTDCCSRICQLGKCR